MGKIYIAAKKYFFNLRLQPSIFRNNQLTVSVATEGDVADQSAKAHWFYCHAGIIVLKKGSFKGETIFTH